MVIFLAEQQMVDLVHILSLQRTAYNKRSDTHMYVCVCVRVCVCVCVRVRVRVCVCVCPAT